MSQFGSLLTKAAGEPLDRLFKRRIADPIGMTQWRWTENDSPVGRVLTWTGGIHTSSRELARFGHLFLNKGNWNGRQLVSASWVEQATSVQVPASVPNDDLPRSRGAGVYGYNWWVNGVQPNGQRLWPGAPPRTFYANGLHNNVCIVVPEWEMVVTRTNGGRKDGAANRPPNVDAIWSGFFARLAEAVAPQQAPIRLHPDNPRYFFWRGKPTVLITSGEHYGGVMNLDFDYVRYLDELKASGFNLTRTFSGTYREVAGSFSIVGNTLAPAPGRYLCPWPCSSTPGSADGGNKFDLAQWDGAYFERLKDFVAQAGRRGIVVENLGKVSADDEIGGADRSDRKYRTEGWDFILAGGGAYDHLDFSFTPEHPDGTAVSLPPGTPGGGGPELRRQLRILKDFIEGFDFVRMRPDATTIAGSRITPSVVGNSKTVAQPTVRVLSQPGAAYAVYVSAGSQAELTMKLPAGTYQAEWVNTKTGAFEKSETLHHADGLRTLASPAYAEDIALRVRRQAQAEVAQ